MAIHFVLFLTSAMILAAGCVGVAMAQTSPAAAKEFPGSDPAPAAPSIASQPVDKTVKPGQTATFAVVATGTATLTYQWKLNGAPIVGAISSVFTTPAATAADDGAQFSVVIGNPVGIATSRTATLTVLVVLPKGEPAASAQDLGQRTRISPFLTNSYAGLQIGSIGYAFSSAQLQPGFQAQSVAISHLAARVVLYGHDFDKYFSVQISEMRPVQWVMYRDVNGDLGTHTVWMNVGGLTAKARLPLSAKWSVFGEGGLGIVTRRGFDINGLPVVTGTSYATLLYGGGLDYGLNGNWDLLASVAAAPGDAASKQPSTVFFSGGFNYTLRHVPEEPAGAGSSNGPLWPKNVIQVGYITDAVGFAVNNAVAKAYLFWSGNVEVASGVSADYRRNLFHTQRFFALDWGAAISSWKSGQNGERFYTVSLYPVLRFPLVRTNPAKLYFSYSFAGPSLITRTNIDDQETGKHFTFQDYMALGIYLGRKRKVAGELRIAHYSNGNLFPENPGVKVPLGLYLGATF